MSGGTSLRHEKYVASCSNCGAILQEAQSDCRCNVICPGCGENVVVIVKKGKVTVFMDRREDEDPAYKEKARMLSYARTDRQFQKRTAGLEIRDSKHN